MANREAMLAKIARNLTQLGFTVTKDTASVVVDNGSNDLTITYVDAALAAPLGGVDPTVSPFLGIGIAKPGKLKVKSVVHAADTVADILDSDAAAQVLVVLAGFANDIILENGDAGFSVTLRGAVDVIGVGS